MDFTNQIGITNQQVYTNRRDINNLMELLGNFKQQLISIGSGGGGGGGISNVVEDTTPQLGGNLDINNHSITGTGNISITGNITATGSNILSGLTYPTLDASAGYILQTNGSGVLAFVDPATSSVKPLPVRPDPPVQGSILYNTTSGKLEFYNGSEWKQITLTDAPSDPGNFYTYQIANSIRGSAADNRTLKRTAGTPTSRDTFTLAYWVKRHNDSTTDSANNIFVTGTGGGTYFYISLGADLFFEGAGGNWSTSYLQTSAAYRDTSAWYHHILVFDSTQSAENDRLKLYVNGERITSFAQDSLHSNIGSSEDFSFINQSGVVQAFGGLSGKGHGTEGADLSLADVMFFDGQAYYSELGETKNGVWIPKDPSELTFGDNGYWLKFTNSSNLGEDFSGNDNDFTVANFAAHDQLLDSPTFGSSNGGNFPIYNPLLKPPSGLALSEGNLKATLTSSDNGIMTNWQVPLTGKWYWEIYIDNIASDHGVYIGVMPANTDLTINQESNNLGLVYYSINGNSILKGTRSSYGATWTTGDIISIAVDRTADTLQFYKNGSGQGTISISTLDKEFFCYMGYTGGSGPCSTILNFGQEGTFAGNVTAGGNGDGTGYGNFKYSVPSGFLALCSGNQPVANAIDPAQTDNDYPQELFFISQFSGNLTGRTITTENQPDLLMIRHYSTGQNWYTLDSTRGMTANKYVLTDTNAAEATLPQTNITSVGATSVGISSGTWLNSTGSDYQMWMWRANGGTTSSGSGDLTSTHQVDPSGGFSIVKAAGDGSGSGDKTVTHGMSAAPDCILAKNLDSTFNWDTYWSSGLTSGYGLRLNTTDGQLSGRWGTVNSSIFTCKHNYTWVGSDNFIYYCFRNIEGYIKVGSYNGNGESSDGTFVYTGFRPAFVMGKGVVAGAAWWIQDNALSPYNPSPGVLEPNTNAATYTSANPNVDFLSNGFKVRNNNSMFNSTSYGPYVYLAFAENPFKYATAR